MSIETKRYKAIPSLVPFHDSDARVRMLVGPFRSGKSVAAIIELAMLSEQIPNSKTMIVRQTYRQLEDTAIPSFFEWIPKHTGTWHVSDLVFERPTKSGGIWQVFFRSAETDEDIEKFKGWEGTNYWIDEAKDVPQKVKMILDGRLSWPTGYPREIFRGILTTNPSDVYSWIYKDFVKDPLPGHVYWKQSARENPYLHKEYYDDLERIYRDKPELKKRYVDGEWGAVYDGKPVYEQEFSRSTHVSKAHLVPYKGIMICRSWDFGLNPACVFSQVGEDGTWYILRELCGDDISIDDFADAVKEFSQREFPDFTFEDVGDPAGKNRSQNDERTCYDILSAKGIYACEAETNALLPRLEAVKYRLTRTNKGKPRLLIDPRCDRVVEGFDGGYKYDERGSTGLFAETPKKDKFSHPHDAVQYAALYLFGYTDPANSRLFSEPMVVRGIVNA